MHVETNYARQKLMTNLYQKWSPIIYITQEKQMRDRNYLPYFCVLLIWHKFWQEVENINFVLFKSFWNLWQRIPDDAYGIPLKIRNFTHIWSFLELLWTKFSNVFVYNLPSFFISRTNNTKSLKIKRQSTAVCIN